MPRQTTLDDLQQIKKTDRSNMLSFCIEAPKHYRKATELAKNVTVDFKRPRTIIVAGMGGSAIGGELLRDWAFDRIEVPIEICREYSLPAYADETTLVFVSSYSGETEETLSALLDALKRKCMIVCTSSGGKLAEFAQKLNLLYVGAPSGMAPRATLPYMFMPMPIILQKMGLTSKVESEAFDTVKVLKQISAENSPEIKTDNNFSKSLAANIKGTVPTIYGFGIYRAVAQRFKTQFNENSKNPAKWEYFPELNHNEIVGWEAAEKFAKWFSVIFIRDAEEPVEIRQRIETTKEIMSKKRLRLFEVQSRGRSSLAKMASVICIGDFASVYLAVLRGIDPTPVETITLLKQKLEQTGAKEKTIRELQKFK
jgi:glucose/mannose-6-phosphate isomerase